MYQSERFKWADEMFARITAAVNANDPFALYGLIADPMPKGFGDRATADAAISALVSDDPLEIAVVIGVFQCDWDNPNQEWPTVDDLA